MSNSLIVFDTAGLFDLFIIPNEKIDETLQLLLDNSAGKYINSDDDIESLLTLYGMLYESYNDEGEPLPTTPELAEYKLEDVGKITTNISDIYVMGIAD